MIAQPITLAVPLRARLVKTLAALTLLLIAATLVGLAVGRQRLDVSNLLSDPFVRPLFFRLRLPRVLMGLLIGASLSLAGGALQALFRNPLADPYTLGVSGGGAFGASIAIAMGWSARVFGIPFVFLASFAGAMLAVSLGRPIARSGTTVLPSGLLVSVVVGNLVSHAAVLAVQQE